MSGNLSKAVIYIPVVTISSIILSSCQLQNADKVGQGDITLSSDVQSAYQSYRSSYQTGYFAVSEDGETYGGYGCPSVYDGCSGVVTAQKAINRCEKASNGVPCYTYGINHRVVWEGDISEQDSAGRTTKQSNASTQKKFSNSGDFSVKSDDKSGDIRKMAIYWDNKYGNMIGEIEINNKKTGDIKIDMDDNVKCTGSYAFANKAEGSWSVACNDGNSASGGFTALGPGKGSVGEGQDQDGNKVEYRVGKL
ncbi:hypothetical protein [Fodinicurvata fenggangensis]|uniref:hypothetical protein n=1 Tax=Fodinicurvata fenggangensis TaxID=1121830 RepID=UPI0012DF42F2|nr:hypothetical protein [Fodinicurvata fenggangensis]